MNRARLGYDTDIRFSKTYHDHSPYNHPSQLEEKEQKGTKIADKSYRFRIPNALKSKSSKTVVHDLLKRDMVPSL